ncbi:MULTISPECIES: tyrosine-type recombinase/integrase [Mycobacterium]|jgi:site-specific recombinase XerC|uniref:Integrase n=1 Tax=Mycobacterium kiyosense TaxID=2871094 RepID=A0A9P3UVU5_9MYCO|nr:MULTISPECIES: tyrosine-type recombinase/integrase [Mycobacterium]KPN48245.1 recombinase [Mycobacterium intracellulare subsp. chimaera]OBF24098.1 recombinase [Mycobacterium kubicae]GLD32265.1 integrase [Mycobacterium kiyosense]GLD38313.1 integrase [Mycobacterium kiyosense]
MSPAEPLSPGPPARTDADRPEWFRAFLADRSTRKPSPHTVDAYRRDFDAIAAVLAGGPEHLAALEPAAITKDAMRQAFATFAASREAASIRRCWSTWNTLCSYLFTAELLGANPMQFVGRPKVAKNLPKSLPAAAAKALVDAVGDQSDAKLRNEWPERDRAIILTTLLSGLRAGELRAANIGDVRLTEHGGVIHVRGKGNKDRAIPIEATLIDVLSDYLASRGNRFPATVQRRQAGDVPALRWWPTAAPLFVGVDGQRITRGALQYRVLRAFRLAGPDAHRNPGALVHSLRHTYATELANTNISVYSLMKLLGHESLATSQRYVNAAGTETRSAAAQNPLYHLAGGGKQPLPQRGPAAPL